MKNSQNKLNFLVFPEEIAVCDEFASNIQKIVYSDVLLFVPISPLLRLLYSNLQVGVITYCGAQQMEHLLEEQPKDRSVLYGRARTGQERTGTKT